LKFHFNKAEKKNKKEQKRNSQRVTQKGVETILRRSQTFGLLAKRGHIDIYTKRLVPPPSDMQVYVDARVKHKKRG